MFISIGFLVAFLAACGGDGGTGDGQGGTASSNTTDNGTTNDGSSNTPWVGNWVQVNFLSDDDNGVWDQDDLDGIGFEVRITEDKWIETNEYVPGCSVTYSYTVDENNRYNKIATSVSDSCPFTVGPFLNESGTLEFSDDNNVMIEYFDVWPGDTLLAFKWMRQ